MDIFRIHGGNRLNGSVKVSGSKNGALPILFASLLCDGEVTLQNVPIALRDIGMSLRILQTLGVESEVAEDGSVSLQVTDSGNTRADYKQVSQMRASICALGPLLARRGKAIVSLPGGCNIGDRPIDLHIRGMEALGAEVTIENGYVMAHAPRLRGGTVYLSGPMGSTVLGTQNVMMAAVGADGDTFIEGAACEPEVRATAGFLRAMGVKIEGDGTHEIHIEGQGRLEGAGCLGATSFDVPPDRIETGTYVLAGAIAGDEVTVEGCIPS
ncbi:MAG: UDP-N-acetylglucosamine 1-carboxyvinyltransferase, partial [Planctomycetota bacterium]